MSTIQHQVAREILPKIISATKSFQLLTYGSVAKMVGRDPDKNARMIAQVCDLLDAAAAYAGRPLLALSVVREKSGNVNRKAWSDTTFRNQIIRRSQEHQFTDSDFDAISKSLAKLDGRGNKTAWDFVYSLVSRDELIHQSLETSLFIA